MITGGGIGKLPTATAADRRPYQWHLRGATGAEKNICRPAQALVTEQAGGRKQNILQSRIKAGGDAFLHSTYWQ